MQPIFFLGKFCQEGKLKMWNVKMKWLLGFSISKIFCIWVFNRLAKNIEGCFKCFLTSISHSEPNLAKSSYGWLSLLTTSQNWPKIKHTPLLFVPMTKEGCIFFYFGMDLLVHIMIKAIKSLNFRTNSNSLFLLLKPTPI